VKITETRPVAGAAAIRKERDASNKYREAQTLTPGDPADSVSVAGIPEAELTPKVRAAISQLMQEVGELRQEVEQSRRRIAYLERLADQDTLLPVYNRRAFVRELSRAISYSERYNEPTSLIYLDLNGFKEVNDKLGHGAGDAALQVVEAQRKSIELADAIAGKQIQHEGNVFTIGAAHGIATFRGGKSVEELIADADEAMYRNKLETKAVKNEG
jgi:GGDEF domain-containing protein